MANKRSPLFASPRFMTRSIAVAGILALSVATGMLFISAQMSLIIYAFAGMALFIGNHIDERRTWESKTEARVGAMQKSQNALHDTVERHSADIRALKATLGKTEGAVPSSRPKAQAEAPPKRRATDQDMTERAKSYSKLLRAEHTPPPVRKPVKTSTADKPNAPIHLAANDGAHSTDSARSYNDTLSDIVMKELVQHAVSHKEIEVFAQPIVRLPRGEVRFYELYGRIKARKDSYVPASRFLDFARKDGVLQDIDNQILMHSLSMLKYSGLEQREASFFINVEAHSIKNSGFMNLLLAFLSKNRSLARHVVLELPQHVFDERDQKMAKILTGLKSLGCSFSLDHVTHFNFDVADLHNAQVRFVKLRADMSAKAMRDPRQQNAFQRAKRQMESNGIGVVFERIEDQRMLDAIAPCQPHYGQGYLFGRPDLSHHYNLRKAA